MRFAKLSLFMLLASAVGARGDMLFTGSSGNLAASVNFHVQGANTLVVTLTNTSTFDTMNPSGVLTGVYFNTSGGTFTPVSALLPGGSMVMYGPQPVGSNVGGEWAYGSGLAAPGGATKGISSTGLGLFGNSNFNGPDLDPPLALDGLNYGLLSDGYAAGGNPAVTGNFPLVKNSTVFTLSFTGSPSFTVSNVTFQYGTALTEPQIPGVTTQIPAPGAAVLAAVGLGLCGWVKRRFAA